MISSILIPYKRSRASDSVFFFFEQRGEKAFFFRFFVLTVVYEETAYRFAQTRVNEAIRDCGGHQIYLRHSVGTRESRDAGATEGVDRPKVEADCGHKADESRLGVKLGAESVKFAHVLFKNCFGAAEKIYKHRESPLFFLPFTLLYNNS